PSFCLLSMSPPPPRSPLFPYPSLFRSLLLLVLVLLLLLLLLLLRLLLFLSRLLFLPRLLLLLLLLPRRLDVQRVPASACSAFGADRKSTRLNSSHLVISYAVFCLKKKK